MSISSNPIYIPGKRTFTQALGPNLQGGSSGVIALNTLLTGETLLNPTITGTIGLSGSAGILWANSSTGNFDMHNSSGTFSTGSGNISLNGATTLTTANGNPLYINNTTTSATSNVIGFQLNGVNKCWIGCQTAGFYISNPTNTIFHCDTADMSVRTLNNILDLGGNMSIAGIVTGNAEYRYNSTNLTSGTSGNGTADIAIYSNGTPSWEITNYFQTAGTANTNDQINYYFTGTGAGNKFNIYGSGKISTANNILDDTSGNCYLGGFLSCIANFNYSPYDTTSAIGSGDPLITLSTSKTQSTNPSKTRWNIGLNSNESGSNAGSDFSIWGYADNGGYLNNPLSITRSTGLVTLNNGISIPTTIGTSNALTLQNTTAATNGVPHPSNQILLKGTTWNSSLNSVVMTAGMQCQYVSTSGNPTVSKLSFLVGTDNATATEKASIDSNGNWVVAGTGTSSINDTTAGTTNIAYTSGTGNTNIGNSTGNLITLGANLFINNSGSGTTSINSSSATGNLIMGNSTGLSALNGSTTTIIGNTAVNINTSTTTNTTIGNSTGATNIYGNPIQLNNATTFSSTLTAGTGSGTQQVKIGGGSGTSSAWSTNTTTITLNTTAGQVSLPSTTYTSGTQFLVQITNSTITSTSLIFISLQSNYAFLSWLVPSINAVGNGHVYINIQNNDNVSISPGVLLLNFLVIN